MQKERILTCIVCPKGCSVRVSFGEDGRIEKIEGNTCKRGVGYAEDECTNPRRTVTSTVRTENGGIVPVKTAAGVPKDLVFDVMREINSITAGDDTRLGDVIIENVLGTGVNVIATANSREDA